MMHRWVTATLLTAALATVSVGAAAQGASPGKAGTTGMHAKSGAGTKVADHTTSGTVKSVSDSSLVVDRGGSKGEMTFTLTPATHKQGTIAAGNRVSVHYRSEGAQQVATAVTASAARTAKTAKRSH